MKTKINLGKIDYNRTGRKINAVDLEVNLKETEQGIVFTMSGSVWNSKKTGIIAGGQMCDEIGKHFKHDKRVQRLVQIWQKYHLNDMNAGTINQEIALEDCKSYDYYARCKHLENNGLLYDNGYKYGTAWLFRQIPDEVIEEVKQICEYYDK